MLLEIKRIVSFIDSDNGKVNRNRLIIILCIVIALLLVNRFVLGAFVSDNFKIAYNQSRLLFKNGLSPYESENQSQITRLAEDEGWEIKNNFDDLGNPIYQFLLFFPFTLIKNYQWSEAVFATINQICVLLSMQMLFNLLKWDPKIKDRIILLFLTTFIFFALGNYLSANISIFQLTLLVGVLYFIEKEKHIPSGILFGFSLIDPISAFYPIIILTIILMSQKYYSTFTWTFITIALLSIFFFVFDRNWIMGWLKYLFLISSRYPFISFINAAEIKYNFQTNRLFAVLPIFLGIWLLIEMIRTPKDAIEKNIWLLSLGGILNYYMMVQSRAGPEILFFPSMILIIGMWWEKLKSKSKIVLYIFLGIISFGLLGWQFYINRNLSLEKHELILLFFGIILIINLYWIRAWVMKPYEVEAKDSKFL